MGGHRKQTASLKFPAKELGVLKKRSINIRTSSAVEEPESEGRQQIKKDGYAFKPRPSLEQIELVKMQCVLHAVF